MNTPRIVPRSEWLAARSRLLEQEKELTRRCDRLAAARRENMTATPETCDGAFRRLREVLVRGSVSRRCHNWSVTPPANGNGHQRTPGDCCCWSGARSDPLSGYLCERLRTPADVADLTLNQRVWGSKP